VIGISPEKAVAATTAYDPTCGSGSLLLKVAAESGKHITLEGQEKDVTTAGLARMNMILHDFPTANIVQGNTLANPKFKQGEGLRTYDYVVANPPFSDKGWSSGLTPANDPYQRFAWGVPPAKQGDYAYLLHIIRSMKSSGKGACILPHGVLFRGNAEAVIRKQLVRSGYLKGIIGLPANLFYGTGIPACILVLDKENAPARALSATGAAGDKKRGIFMIDASKGFIKDGPKNRLREQDLHRIVDAFGKQVDVPRFARMVPFDEIADPKNDYNLNLPRYIDSSSPEDIQDIHAHLNGGIPARDIDGEPEAAPPIPGLSAYWAVFPSLRNTLFRANAHPGYLDLAVEPTAIKTTILEHEEFAAFRAQVTERFAQWRADNTPRLKGFDRDGQPKELITTIGEALLDSFRSAPLLDPYDLYQHLMDYWAETLQDDAYEIAADGWVAETRRVLEEVKGGKKKGEMKDKGWTCDLIPKPYIVARYFANEQAGLDALQAELEALIAETTELEEEHGGEDGAFAELDKINKSEVSKRLKEIKAAPEYADETRILKQWNKLEQRQSALKKQIKEADAALDQLAYEKYRQLSVDEIKTLVVDDKWLTALSGAVQGELERVSQTLTGRVRELAERYAATLPQLTDRVAELSTRVDEHLKKMGAVWG
jgi:type I restriction enzyme M protein